MTKKYIDVDQLWKCETCFFFKNGKCTSEWCDCMESYRPAFNSLKFADVAPVVHGEWIVTTKHKWKTNESGEIDECAWDYEFHNGAVCLICGFAPCIHCNPEWMEDDRCHKHFVCSVCGLHAEEKYLYCHCGAKMDGGNE